MHRRPDDRVLAGIAVAVNVAVRTVDSAIVEEIRRFCRWYIVMRAGRPSMMIA